jgi:hypothetical protein
MTNLSDRFFDELVKLGARRRTHPGIFLTVWCAESDLSPSAVNPHGGARGLNQMMPATLQSMGAPADFEKRAAEDQLPWIERLIAAREPLNGGPFESAARYYHANFFPRTMARGFAPSTIVVARDAEDSDERAAYAANSGLDVDQDGKITLDDLAKYLERVRTTRCQDAFARLARAVDAAPFPSYASVMKPRKSNGGLVFGLGLMIGVVSLVAWRAS